MIFSTMLSGGSAGRSDGRASVRFKRASPVHGPHTGRASLRYQVGGWLPHSLTGNVFGRRARNPQLPGEAVRATSPGPDQGGYSQR